MYNKTHITNIPTSRSGWAGGGRDRRALRYFSQLDAHTLVSFLLGQTGPKSPSSSVLAPVGAPYLDDRLRCPGGGWAGWELSDRDPGVGDVQRSSVSSAFIGPLWALALTDDCSQGDTSYSRTSMPGSGCHRWHCTTPGSSSSRPSKNRRTSACVRRLVCGTATSWLYRRTALGPEALGLDVPGRVADHQ